MFCSTVIPTIGRSSLDRTVNSVLDQTLAAADFEVIVVNDSGRPLPPAAWQEDERVTILDTQRRERSVARNTGAAVAKGSYLHFLDDDDWLLPNALTNLYRLAQSDSDAVWLYGASQLVDREENPVIRLQPQLAGNVSIEAFAGEWFPLQSSLIQTEPFFIEGGFNPLAIDNEDIDLSRRLSLRGNFACTKKAVACIGMGEENSTTNRSRGLIVGRQVREDVLKKPGVMKRFLEGAEGGYWYGRITRAYLTSALWNGKQGRLLTALSRFGWGMISVALAARYLPSPDYWRAVLYAYESVTFAHALQEGT